jgi:acetylornithine deacetylase/succinyl-diaminopimelate desuccinylase-like protein
MDADRANRFVEELWEDSILPRLTEYIRIPSKSPHFDPEWESRGYMDDAVTLIESWCRHQPIRAMSVEVLRIPERTPLIFIDIPGQTDRCILLYGHLDKQPEMGAWRPGLGPWMPVREGERLYGRGGADDGYAAFASLAAILALQDQGVPQPRCVVIIEACEESGSYDLPYYIDTLADRIGAPDLVVCLDSGCGNYQQLWCTTSLRGLTSGTLRVEVLHEAVHSGDASGIVPSSFRILRGLLERLEDSATGRILSDAFHVAIPPDRREQAVFAASILGDSLRARFPFVAGGQPVSNDGTELVLNRTWRPALEIIGADGIPSLRHAGNVLRPATALVLSLRLPPTCDAQDATRKLTQILEADPPCGAQVRFKPGWGTTGWNAPAFSPWLEQSIERASRTFFGRPAVHMGEGGTIPFMGMLGEKFPQAQFLITGVLGPQSNAHGPNEFLHIPTAKRLTGCVAKVMADLPDVTGPVS